MALRGDTRSLRNLNKRLTQMPKVLAQQVAREAAQEITALAQASYDSGQTVYGDARPRGVHGNELTLVQTGFTRGALRFVSDGGTKIRAALGRPYARFLVGKYRILPIGNSALPFAWAARLKTLVQKHVERALQEAA